MFTDVGFLRTFLLVLMLGALSTGEAAAQSSAMCRMSGDGTLWCRNSDGSYSPASAPAPAPAPAPESMAGGVGAETLDCSNPKSETEHAICGDAQLLEYERERANFSSGLSHDRIATWLVRRDHCRADTDCLGTAYLGEIAALRFQSADTNSAPAIAVAVPEHEPNDVGSTAEPVIEHAQNSSESLAPGDRPADIPTSTLIIGFAVGIVVYFLPFLLAKERNGRKFLLNLLFGWTIFGWFALMPRASPDLVYFKLYGPSGVPRDRTFDRSHHTRHH